MMNLWTKLSIEYANQRSYLDDLFQVYPTIPEGIRERALKTALNKYKLGDYKNGTFTEPDWLYQSLDVKNQNGIYIEELKT